MILTIHIHIIVKFSAAEVAIPMYMGELVLFTRLALAGLVTNCVISVLIFCHYVKKIIYYNQT